MSNSNKPLLSKKLSSTRREIPKVEAFVDELNQTLQLEEPQYNTLMLALSEAVTNAVVHGNKEDATKTVTLQAWKEKGDLHISVKDQGDGFDPGLLPNPLNDQNLLKEGGRGVFLMKQYADNVEYRDGGSTVVLTFNLE